MVTEISIKNRVAQTVKNGIVTAANEGNFIEFKFDEEWEPDSITATRTARFVANDEIVVDIPFNGSICPMPVFYKPCNVYVGVFWNSLRASDYARIIYSPSALSGAGFPDDPPEEVYNRIIELMNGKLNADKLDDAVENALAQAKENGEFDGNDGFSPTVNLESIPGGTRVIVVDKYSPKAFVVMDGTDGVGISSIDVIESDANGGNNEIYINLDDGTQEMFFVRNGKDGKTPEKHIDYFTPSDVQDIAKTVIETLPIYEGEAEDE